MLSDADYDSQRRWKRVLEAISERPNLERAQAEAMARNAEAEPAVTEQQKRELWKRVEARFGPSPNAPKAEPVVASPEKGAPNAEPKSTAAEATKRSPRQAQAAKQARPQAQRESQTPAPPRPREQLRLAFEDSSLEAPHPPTQAKARRRPHVPTADASERQFRHLVYRLGTDKAAAVLADLRRQYAVE
jgi:hypothetical protein